MTYYRILTKISVARTVARRRVVWLERDELYRSLNSTKPETYNYTVKEAELKIKVNEVRKLKRETKAEYYNLEFNKSKNDLKKNMGNYC